MGNLRSRTPLTTCANSGGIGTETAVCYLSSVVLILTELAPRCGANSDGIGTEVLILTELAPRMQSVSFLLWC